MYLMAIECNPYNKRSYFKLGRLYYRQRDFEHMRKIFDQYIAIESDGEDSTDAYMYLHYGFSYCVTGDHEKAIELFKKALEINPYIIEPYFAIAQCYQEQNKLQEANAYLSMVKGCPRLQQFSQNTIYNYREVKDMITSRGIQLVCVQYVQQNTLCS